MATSRTTSARTTEQLAAEIIDLKTRLHEAEETIEAIRSGSIDAIVVEGENKQQIFTLKSADYTYRMLIESMNQGALTITKTGTILYSNKQFGSMMDKPLEHVIGSQLQSYISPKQRSVLDKKLADTRPASWDVTLEVDCSPYMAIMISATTLPSENTAADMSVVITDMTERKKAEAAKDEFVSLASHQLRTPATGVKMYLGMLLDGFAGKLSEKNRVFIQTAFNSNERQLMIINDILKTAQIDSGAYELQKSPHLLEALLDEVLVDFRPIASMRNQVIDCVLEPNVMVQVDPNEVRLVISNLIENASKYSPEGTSIDVKIFTNKRQACLQITDHGVGILEADKNRIFDKFTRVDNALSDTVDGSGLGLYWVRRIVKMHDGDITVTSKANLGSTFTVRLPL